jgi:hypothetical protein
VVRRRTIKIVTEFHSLSCEVTPAGLLFECDVIGCGRRVGIDRATREFVVIDRGDPLALHRGSIGGIELAAPTVDLQ